MVWEMPKIEHLKPTIYGWTVSCPEGLLLEPETDLGCYCYINAKYSVIIRRGAKLGSHVSVYSEDTIGGHSGPVVIGENVCIGSHSIILPNVVLNKGLIIPAFSFIKKSILSQEDLDRFLMSNSNKPFDFGGLL